MAYQALVLSVSTPPLVRRLIHRIETHSFADVHTMLRLPVPNYRLDAGCNFAIAQVLLTAVGGISATLYRQGATDGQRFKGLLRDHFPWGLESTQDVPASEAARIIYEVFRNPLTHDLGLDLHGKSNGIKVKVKRLQRPLPKGGLTEKWIEKLERRRDRPDMSSSLTVRPDKAVLLIEALYWGLRRMVEAMTHDEQLMAKSNRFLAARL